jgi:hypothetical protein
MIPAIDEGIGSRYSEGVGEASKPSQRRFIQMVLAIGMRMEYINQSLRKWKAILFFRSKK